MNVILLIKIIVTLSSCIYCSFTDVKKRIIKNYITFPLMLFGIIINIIDMGVLGGLKASMLGILLMFIICTPFSLIGGLGFGDTKLFMAIASVFGFKFGIDVLLYSLFIMILFFIVFKRQNIKKLFSNLKIMSMYSLLTKRMANMESEDSAWGYVPYACFITIGTITAIIYQLITGGNLVWNILNLS